MITLLVLPLETNFSWTLLLETKLETAILTVVFPYALICRSSVFCWLLRVSLYVHTIPPHTDKSLVVMKQSPEHHLMANKVKQKEQLPKPENPRLKRNIWM